MRSRSGETRSVLQSPCLGLPCLGGGTCMSSTAATSGSTDREPPATASISFASTLWSCLQGKVCLSKASSLLQDITAWSGPGGSSIFGPLATLGVLLALQVSSSIPPISLESCVLRSAIQTYA